MVIQAQVELPLSSILFAFKFSEDAPYRYYLVDSQEFSEPGYLAQVSLLNVENDWIALQEDGYTELLDGTIDVLVLDTIRCPILDAGKTLKKLALRMN